MAVWTVVDDHVRLGPVGPRARPEADAESSKIPKKKAYDGRVATLPEAARFAATIFRLLTIFLAARLSPKTRIVGLRFRGGKRLILEDLARPFGRPHALGRHLPRSSRRGIPGRKAVGWLDWTIRRVSRVAFRLAPRNVVIFAMWGYDDQNIFGLDLKALGYRTIYVETGLLGFGASERAPLISYMPDTRRAYFDGRGPSDLEALLNDLEPGWWRGDRDAEAFLDAVRRSGQEKYGAITAATSKTLTPDDILVVGQVAHDQSWVYTDTPLADNVDLVVRAVREHGKGRRCFYKPHPFYRWNGRDIARLNDLGVDVDLIEPSASFRRLASTGPRIATNTSGAGLEAAFLGCHVVVYGAAFYAGWGFTHDVTPLPRRRNRLSAVDVYAAVMLRYSRYFFRKDGSPASIAQVIAHLRAAA